MARLRKWNAPTVGPRPFTKWKGPIPTADAPQTTPIVRLSTAHGVTAAGSATMVLTMPDCYPDDLIFCVFATGGLASPLTNSAGLAFTNGVQFGPGAVCAMQYFSRRASASTNGGLSADAGQTATFTAPDTTQQWIATVFVVGGVHRTYATAINQAVQTTASAATSIAITGGTPTVENGLQVTIAAYGGTSSNNSNTFARELAVSGGGTEYLFDQTSTPGTSTTRGRALAMWVNYRSPVNGTLQATRTASLQGVVTGSFAGLSFTFAPMLAEAGDNFWDVPAQYHMASDTLNRMDVLLPATGTRPATGWPTVLYVHGGVTGNKRLETNTEDAVLALLAAPYNCAVVSMHYRGVGATQPQNTGVDRAQDIQATIQYLKASACARYGLSTNVAGFGTSAGASQLAGAMLIPNDPILTRSELGIPGVDASFDAVLLWFPETNMAAVNTQFTALGITRSQTAAETAGSSEEIHLMGYANLTYNGQWQGIKNEPRFDATTFPMTGSPANDTTRNRYNILQPQYWAEGRDSLPTPKTMNIRISHGNLDDQVPVLQSYNTGTGVGSTSPTGFYQKLVASGFDVTYNENTGANHDLATLYWKPSTYVGALAGGFVDADLAWLAAAAAGTLSDSANRISRRRRGIMTRHHNRK